MVGLGTWCPVHIALAKRRPEFHKGVSRGRIHRRHSVKDVQCGVPEPWIEPTTYEKLILCSLSPSRPEIAKTPGFSLWMPLNMRVDASTVGFVLVGVNVDESRGYAEPRDVHIGVPGQPLSQFRNAVSLYGQSSTSSRPDDGLITLPFFRTVRIRPPRTEV